ncbi:MAG: TIGR04222 domain-containing membrane protein [Verrucomicrobia bacterium]|nr:TIGR04222 domain-containing membrane protein [Verrucomicrobiota bacterium]
MTVLATSIFDWKGPDFLGLYAVAFFFALAWSVWRRFRANKKFAHPDALQVELTDPYDMAFLAGGTSRCSQVAVVKLLKVGSVEWVKTKILKESRLLAKGQAYPDFHEIERTLFSSILGYGKKGMPLASVSQLVATRVSGIESKLAKLGLRPTSSEGSGRVCFIALPMLVLVLVGLVKVAVGVSRDKPVLFLCLMIGVTLLACIGVTVARKKLTSEGEEVLARLRDRASSYGNGSNHLPGTMCSVALLGISGMAYDESLAGLDTTLKKEISQMGNSSSSSGCGSSGCSSGCGSGCGGCGGD